MPDAVPRPAWERTNWFATAVIWIQRQLARAGVAQTGVIQPMKQWPFSCVLHVPTSDGSWYFKACPVTLHKATSGFFVNEAMLTRLVTRYLPDFSPTLLAVDEQQGWMLLQDGGLRLSDDPSSFHQWEQALLAVSRFQQASVTHLPQLLEQGVPDRRLEHLATHALRLMQTLEEISFLKREEREHLQRASQRLLLFSHQLAQHQIPMTIVHGDLHPGNIAFSSGGEPFFFDWSDLCVSHPFFDSVPFLYSRHLKGKADLRFHLRTLYLKQWTQYEASERLDEAMRLAHILGKLHRAVSFSASLSLITSSEERLLKQSLTFWLRSFVQDLKLEIRKQ